MRLRWLSLLLGLACGFLVGPTLAQEPEVADSSVQPAVPVSLQVTEGGPQLPWRMEIRNDGDVPVVLAADPQLLWLEVKAPGKKRTEICRLPKELFPARADRQAELRLEPGTAAARAFDPRLYCYSEGGQHQLVPGAQVTPHFGWPENTKTTWSNGKRVETVIDEPPYVAQVVTSSPPVAGEPAPARVKVIEGTTFALGSTYAAWSSARLPGPDTSTADFDLKLAAGSDAHAERTATIRLSLRNRSNRSRYVYFRRELISFEVMGPDGLVQCDPEPDFRAPERHSYSYLPAGKSLTVTSRLVELCPRGTFGRPGLYLIHARFDAAQDGDEFDLDAFVGRASSHDAVGVRIRTGEKYPMRLQPVLQISTATPAPAATD